MCRTHKRTWMMQRHHPSRQPNSVTTELRLFDPNHEVIYPSVPLHFDRLSNRLIQQYGESGPEKFGGTITDRFLKGMKYIIWIIIPVIIVLRTCSV